MTGYRNKSISVLEKTLLSGPRFARVQYAERLERLILTLEDEAVFSWEYVYFKITGFRPDQGPDTVISGSSLSGDLTLLLEKISRHFPISVTDVPEPVLTSSQVAQSFNVSPRTIYRWRRRGLPARIYTFPDGRERAGIRESSLQSFQEKNKRLVARSSQFSLISGKERKKLKRMLRQTIKEKGCSQTEAIKQVAARSGRAAESIRLMLQDLPVSPTGGIGPSSRLTQNHKLAIYRSICAGTPAAELAEKYNRSPQSIYRTFNAVRGQKMLRTIPEPERIILPEKWSDDEPLPAVKERNNIFLTLNFIKKRISLLRNRIDPARYVQATLLNELERLNRCRRMVELILLKNHLPLIIDTAKYHCGRGLPLNRLINISLGLCLLSINQFDYRMNHSFESFLRLRLLKKLAFLLPLENPPPTERTAISSGNSEQKRAMEELITLLAGAKTGLNEEVADYVKKNFGLRLDPFRKDLLKIANRIGIATETSREIMSRLKDRDADN